MNLASLLNNRRAMIGRLSILAVAGLFAEPSPAADIDQLAISRTVAKVTPGVFSGDYTGIVGDPVKTANAWAIRKEGGVDLLENTASGEEIRNILPNGDFTSIASWPEVPGRLWQTTDEGIGVIWDVETTHGSIYAQTLVTGSFSKVATADGQKAYALGKNGNVYLTIYFKDWTATLLAEGHFIGLATNWQDPRQCFVLDAGGISLLVWWPEERPTGWKCSPVVSGSYSSIVGNPDKTILGVYAFRADGGIDLVYSDNGSWVVEPVSGLTSPYRFGGENFNPGALGLFAAVREPDAAPTPAAAAAGPALKFSREFAPQEGWVAPVEKPFREEICLNGLWQFQPVATGAEKSNPPLPAPRGDAWEKTPIKIPSPWNVNAFCAGNGPRVFCGWNVPNEINDGGDFRAYPSYPKSWEKADMGWLRRSVRVPETWRGRRILLRFEAVAGDCQVLVNGREVGRNFDIFMPLQIDITDAVRFDAPNEILVGVRKASLLNEPGKYGPLTYPNGSFWGDFIVGIWQDVFLVAASPVRVENVFVKPLVDKSRLELEVGLINNTASARNVQVTARVYPWVNLAQSDILHAPEPTWKLGDKPALEFAASGQALAPGGQLTTQLGVAVDGKLKFWAPDSPQLYGAVVEISENGKVIDRKYVRFGWRQFGIVGSQFTLNGKPIQLFGDAWHFMGVPQMTRRYAWAWFRALKDANANAVRFTPQPYPSSYLDVADEMGILVLDESAIWGSHANFNFDAPVFWERLRAHVDALVLRDRNHPSVFGWSVSNEVFGVVLKSPPPEYIDGLYDKILVLANSVKELDPTRPWISSDGDGDMNGRLPVVLYHYGDIAKYKEIAAAGKVFGVGEGSIAYWGTPKEAAKFVGDRAYESAEGRMDGVAVDAYNLIANGQRPSGAAYCSIFNVVYYGLQPLPLGLGDQSRSSTLADGVFFGDYVEGKPGMQPERLGPYCTPLNPGYDPKLPLYIPWPLFDAVKAAYAPGRPADCKWAHPPKPASAKPVFAGKIDRIAFVGEAGGTLHASLDKAGVPLADGTSTQLMVIDGSSLKTDTLPAVRQRMENVTKLGGTVLLWGVTRRNLDAINGLLPAPVQLTKRQAVSLVKRGDDPATRAITLADLYFAESPSGQTILEAGLAGPFVEKGKVLLEACNTDWLRLNTRPENIKTVSVLRSERESKPGGAALVAMPVGKGRILLCNLEPSTPTPQHVELVRSLMGGLGVKLGEPRLTTGSVLAADGTLQEALVIGGFQGTDFDNALDQDFLGAEGSVAPKPGEKVGDLTWAKRASGVGGVFDLQPLEVAGPAANRAAYLSFWIYSSRPLDELLAQPDVPQINVTFGAGEAMKAWFNGKALAENRTRGPIDSNRQTFNALPLKKGWNHFLIKVAKGSEAWRFSARFACSNPQFLGELQSASEPPPGK